MRRKPGTPSRTCERPFLSIQAQDFIEERARYPSPYPKASFLSIQAQDFIEDNHVPRTDVEKLCEFLSIQAQDFIEETAYEVHTDE